jgi:histone deacetylase 1/2
LFIYSKKDIILFLLVYVDDVLLTGNDSQVMSDIIRQLGVHVSLKDLSDLHYFIGVEVQQTREGIFLSQQKYIRDLLKRTNMEGARPIHTQLSTKPTLQLNDGHPPADQKQYKSVIGALQYLAITDLISFLL